jgi:hypothetical protein
MRELHLDPAPAAKLDSVHATQPRLADMIEERLDWIETEPIDPRARRRRFTNGMWAIIFAAGGSDWLILWEEDPPGQPVIRFLGETVSL